MVTCPPLTKVRLRTGSSTSAFPRFRCLYFCSYNVHILNKHNTSWAICFVSDCNKVYYSKLYTPHRLLLSRNHIQSKRLLSLKGPTTSPQYIRNDDSAWTSPRQAPLSPSRWPKPGHEQRLFRFPNSLTTLTHVHILPRAANNEKKLDALSSPM